MEAALWLIGPSDTADDKEKTNRLIGVAICIVGNCCISLALNVQKLAHLRLSKEQKGSKQNATANDGDATEAPSERTSLLAPPAMNHLGRKPPPLRTSLSDPAVSSPPNDEREDPSHVIVAIPIDGKKPKRPDAKRRKSDKPRVDKVYLKSKLWWTGLALLNVGELGNFTSYAFCPASVVAPLGTVALVANCFLAPLMLKEPFRKQDLLGVAFAIVGGATVVYASKSSDVKLYPDELLHAISQTAFVIYTIVSFVLIAALGFLSRTRWGDKYLMIDIGLAALAGGYTVLSTKAFSSFLSLMFLDTFKYWITYPILAVLVATALLQVNFINKALQRFEARIVVPSQFCSFSLSAIIGSAVLYREFDGVEPAAALNFVFGCAISAFGVYLLTRANQKQSKPSQSPRNQERFVASPITDESIPFSASSSDPSTPKQIPSLSLNEDDLPVLTRPAVLKSRRSIPSSILNGIGSAVVQSGSASLRARTLSVTLGGGQYLLAQSPGGGGLFLPVGTASEGDEEDEEESQGANGHDIADGEADGEEAV